MLWDHSWSCACDSLPGCTAIGCTEGDAVFHMQRKIEAYLKGCVADAASFHKQTKNKKGLNLP